MSKFQHTIAVTAIVEYQGRFLFIKRTSDLANFANKWVFPGGKVEPGEDIIEALFRELKEEIGVPLHDGVAFLSAYQFIRKEDDSSSQGLVFLVRAKSSKVKVDTNAIQDYQWILPEEVLDYDTIYGMEVHVQNAVIALRKDTFLDRRLFSVSHYQKMEATMSREYLKNLSGSSDFQKVIDNEGYINKNKNN